MIELAENKREAKTLGTEDIKWKFRQAATAVDVQHMLSKASSQCFRKCVPRPQEALDGSEEHCIVLCADRYVDSYNLVARAFVKRLQRELRRGLELKKSREKGQEKASAGGVVVAAAGPMATKGKPAENPTSTGARVHAMSS